MSLVGSIPLGDIGKPDPYGEERPAAYYAYFYVDSGFHMRLP